MGLLKSLGAGWFVWNLLFAAFGCAIRQRWVMKPATTHAAIVDAVGFVVIYFAIGFMMEAAKRRRAKRRAAE